MVDCRPVGTGETALKYLAPYIFRVAISNNRIVKLAEDKVTFRYRANDKQGGGAFKTMTLFAEAFIRCFLQHVLPSGFVKVRYYGLFAPGNRVRLACARQLLNVPAAAAETAAVEPESEPSTQAPLCPKCGQPLRVQQRLPRRSSGRTTPTGQQYGPNASAQAVV